MFEKVGTTPPQDIQLNSLLRGEGEPTKTLEEAILFKRASEISRALSSKQEADNSLNISQLDLSMLTEVLAKFGEAGLFKLLFLCTKSNTTDFKHFISPILEDIVIRNIFKDELGSRPTYDNQILPQSRALEKFATNFVQPSLSRKLYNPGRNHGFLVYGLGGPRILVSHPFYGLSRDTYDVYNNSLEHTRGLMRKGYYGTFLFLDYLQGLNRKFHDIEGWLLWFSLIATHSDLVIFVKEEGKDFRGAQKLEVEFTPDRIPKKIVEFPSDEFRLAKRYEHEEIPETVLYAVRGKKGFATKEEWELAELEFATPLLENFARGSIPNNFLFVLKESGDIEVAPLESWK